MAPNFVALHRLAVICTSPSRMSTRPFGCTSVPCLRIFNFTCSHPPTILSASLHSAACAAFDAYFATQLMKTQTSPKELRSTRKQTRETTTHQLFSIMYKIVSIQLLLLRAAAHSLTACAVQPTVPMPPASRHFCPRLPLTQGAPRPACQLTAATRRAAGW